MCSRARNRRSSDVSQVSELAHIFAVDALLVFQYSPRPSRLRRSLDRRWCRAPRPGPHGSVYAALEEHVTEIGFARQAGDDDMLHVLAVMTVRGPRPTEKARSVEQPLLAFAVQVQRDNRTLKRCENGYPLGKKKTEHTIRWSETQSHVSRNRRSASVCSTIFGGPPANSITAATRLASLVAIATTRSPRWGHVHVLDRGRPADVGLSCSRDRPPTR